MFGLPFDEIWAADFEYEAKSGARPSPVCMVAKELISGRAVRLWRGEFGPEPPFRIDARVLFVAWYAPAELSCFLALGWSLPARILDLYAEFRVKTNGLSLPLGRSLLKPNGELRFFEHVRSHSRWLGMLEDAIMPIWSRVGGGCHPNRDTAAAIEAAGFKIERLERFSYAPLRFVPAHSHILGIARATR